MAKVKDPRAELLAAYLEARDAVPVHLRAQADAELAVAGWLRDHRGVPAELLYLPDGSPRDPELEELEAAVEAAQEAVRWCQAVEVAAAEEYKGEALEDVMERNARGRELVAAARRRAEEGDG